MNFQQVRIIREALRHNFNLTAAAETLNTSAPGLSKHIRDLEDELGLQIFMRRGRRLVGLTPAGEAVARTIERIGVHVDELERLADEFEQGDTGVLKLAATHAQARYLLPKYIAEFRKSFPQVRLDIKQLKVGDVRSAILAHEVDVGFATESLGEYPDILAVPYATWEHVFVVPKDHPLTAPGLRSVAEVAAYPLITYDEGFTGRARIDEAFKAAGIDPDFVVVAIDSDVVKTYVETGLGVGIIASIAHDPERDGNLIRVPVGRFFRPSASSVIVRKGRPLRKFAYRFLDLLSPSALRAMIRDPGLR